MPQTKSGPVFVSANIHGIPLECRLTANAISKQYKKMFKNAGLDCSAFSSHSLRKGGARHASLSGATASTIQLTGGWKSTCFLKYTSVDAETAFADLDSVFD